VIDLSFVAERRLNISGHGLAGQGAAGPGEAWQGKAWQLFLSGGTMKRLVIMSDLHCGHRAGLTPPEYQFNKERNKFGQWQATLWDQYTEAIEKYQPIDWLVINGDAIDGKGERSGGTEQITVDRDEQTDMAYKCINAWDCKRVSLTYGTGYHTGNEEDWEGELAATLMAEIHSHAFIDVDGVVFDIKHHVGSSSVPHGRNTAISRDRLWNMLWQERGLQPKATVLIRSHVHYFIYNGDARVLNMVTPALQLPSSKYGGRRCSGTVDCGFVVFDCEDGKYSWTAEIFDLSFIAKEAIKL
jgi:hypothetical protein